MDLDKSILLENVPQFILMRIICTHMLQNEAKEYIIEHIYDKWTHEIVRVFPQEKTTVYFHNELVNSYRGITSRLGGKLPNQIHNFKRQCRDTDVILNRCRSTLSLTSPNAFTPNLNLRLPVSLQIGEKESADENIQWLKSSNDPWKVAEEK